ncbi:hypothetical protein MAPG_03601 [Magnaporthiopsis poae ATCC 64411]|uniref:Uncharacterized protein n=1 Tax=Magnaporthiopsis poae (strain ATCC 64411 / 73-15) TaxID=644358 RepID=A0A0C4DUG1_MAGP6|nr:hypothetical protein MAPG_03601 [Magnaporthiopsis poae ATCC 64411]
MSSFKWPAIQKEQWTDSSEASVACPASTKAALSRPVSGRTGCLKAEPALSLGTRVRGGSHKGAVPRWHMRADRIIPHADAGVPCRGAGRQEVMQCWAATSRSSDGHGGWCWSRFLVRRPDQQQSVSSGHDTKCVELGR